MKGLILLTYVHILRSVQICLFSVPFWLGEYLDQEILTAKVSNLYTVCFNKLPQTLVENLFFSSLDSRGRTALGCHGNIVGYVITSIIHLHSVS